MKTGKKIAVALAAALVVAIFAGGAVSMVGASTTVELRVTVAPFDVDIVVDTTDFEDMVAGGDASEIRAFDLTNNGPIPVTVEAKFLPDEEEGQVVHGFYVCGEGDMLVIPAENLMLNDIALKNDGTDVVISTLEPGEDVIEHTATLSVPQEQEIAEYVGKIELTFSAA